MKTILLGLFTLLTAGSVMADIDASQANKMHQQGALLLDVREADEYAEVHAADARLIPLGQLESRLNEIASFKNKPVAVMCRSGRRSAKAVQLLEQAGYTQVSNVGGGIIAWQNAGLEVIRKH